MTVPVAHYQQALDHQKNAEPENLALRSHPEFGYIPLINNQVWVRIDKDYLRNIEYSGSPLDSNTIPVFQSLITKPNLQAIVFSDKIREETYVHFQEPELVEELKPGISLLYQEDDRISASDCIRFFDQNTVQSTANVPISLIYDFEDGNLYVPVIQRGHPYIPNDTCLPDNISMFEVVYDDEHGHLYSIPGEHEFMTEEDMENQTGWTPYKITMNANVVENNFPTPFNINDFLEREGIPLNTKFKISPIYDGNELSDQVIRIYQLEEGNFGIFQNIETNEPTLLHALKPEGKDAEWEFSLDRIKYVRYDEFGENFWPVEFIDENTPFTFHGSIAKANERFAAYLTKRKKQKANNPDVENQFSMDNIYNVIFESTPIKLGLIGLVVFSMLGFKDILFEGELTNSMFTYGCGGNLLSMSLAAWGAYKGFFKKN
jgi:hypothetical protein